MKTLKRKTQNFCVLWKYLRNQKQYVIFNVLCLLVSTTKSLFVLFFSKIIIDELTYESNFVQFIIKVSFYAGFLIAIGFLSIFLDKKRAILTERLAKEIEIDVCDNISKMPIEQLERSDVKDDITLVKDSQFLLTYINLLYRFISQVVTIIGYIAIIASLDFKVILLIALMVLMKSISQVKEVKAWDICREETASLSRQGLYISNFGMDPGGAKEIRINRLENWFSKISAEINKKACLVFNREFRRVLLFQIFSVLIYAIQISYSYYCLTNAVITNQISVGTYSMFVATIIAFTQGLGNLAQIISDYKKNGIQLEKLRKFTQKNGLDLCDVSHEFNEDFFSLEIRNLWFKYPSSDDYVLKNINFKIESGEKISIIGVNGAGKTTLIKLICRFYEPTKGEILLNGKNINSIDIESYYKYLSIVFQDYKVFPFSIEENIRMGNSNPLADIEKITKQANIFDRISILEKGLETSIFRLFDDSGVDFSGGEQQRIVLARSLYKEAPIIVLDEPTSKLDAVAEFDFYKTVEEIATKKTVIYISHRLSGVSLCNRAIVIDNGTIIQDGSPKALINVNGKYREMFYKQSVGYKLTDYE